MALSDHPRMWIDFDPTQQCILAAGVIIPACMRSQDFDGYGTVETGVPGAVYLSHSPFTERRLNFVGTEFCARGEGHARV